MSEPISRLQDALGAHFVFLEPDHSSEMVVVANWGAVLRARMAGEEVR